MVLNQIVVIETRRKLFFIDMPLRSVTRLKDSQGHSGHLSGITSGAAAKSAAPPRVNIERQIRQISNVYIVMNIHFTF